MSTLAADSAATASTADSAAAAAAPEQSAEASAGHGRGDRSEYYRKWDKLANDVVAEVEAEEEKEKKEAADQLGHNSGAPRSKAEAEDLAKRAALKEAKKKWDGIEESKAAQKAVVEGESKQENRIITAEEDLAGRGVIVLKNNTDCSYVLPASLDNHKILKLFVEDCARCTLDVHCNMITSCIEVAHCEQVTVNVKRPILTVQVDLSEGVAINYSQNAFTRHVKVYHSACRDMRVSHDVRGNNNNPDLAIVDDFEMSKLEGQAAAEEQYVTRYFQGSLVTDLVLRDAGNHPTTARDIELRKKRIQDAAREMGMEQAPEVQAALSAEDPLTRKQRAEKMKTEGNKAFKERDYAQASVHYTQAIGDLEVEGVDDPTMLCALYSNRAACCLKLGRHESALEDATAGLRHQPDHVKCLFRKGLALHAMERFEEACPVLGRASQLQPNNKQILTALQFAQRRAAQKRRGN